jgi:hypothetical protein
MRLELVAVPVTDVDRAKAFNDSNTWSVQQITPRE